LDDIRSRDKSTTFNSTRRITIENIPAVNNTEILADVLGNNEAIFRLGKTHRHRKKAEVSTSLSRPDSARSLNAPGSARSYYFNTSRLSVPKLNQTQNISTASDPYGLQKSIPKINLTGGGDASVNDESQYTWDYHAEREFKHHKEEARARMFNEIKSSSWNEVGLGPFIQVSHKEETEKSQRNHLLERYKKGEALGIKEYTKIANTSLLLNSYSDTQFIQSIVNQLEPEVIEAVRLFFQLSCNNIL